MYKIDLHTHFCLSPDGGINEAEYRGMLASGKLNYIAITDHNEVSFARKLHKQLGDQIIIGEEINTGEGEIIGLYLKEKIETALGAKQYTKFTGKRVSSIFLIHLKKFRRGGLQAATLSRIINEVDIIETHNGRAYFSKNSIEARQWAKTCSKAAAASSDAHGSTWLG